MKLQGTDVQLGSDGTRIGDRWNVFSCSSPLGKTQLCINTGFLCRKEKVPIHTNAFSFHLKTFRFHLGIFYKLLVLYKASNVAVKIMHVEIMYCTLFLEK